MNLVPKHARVGRGLHQLAVAHLASCGVEYSSGFWGAQNYGTGEEDGGNRPGGQSSDSTSSPRHRPGYTSRLPPGHERLGHALLRNRPDRYDRMKLLLGYYDLPYNRLKAKERDRARHALSKVWISNLQSIQYMPFSAQYKTALLSYRVSTLNEELSKQLRSTSAFMASTKEVDFVPIIPGVTSTYQKS